MVARVLVPMDDSAMAAAALEFALETFPAAEVTVLHVAGAPTSFMGGAMSLAMSDDIDSAVAERAEPVFDRAQEIADDHGVEIVTDVALGSPAKTIIDHAEGFDLIVIGSHSSSLASRLLLGNVAETVTQNAPIPVTVVR
ncbi:universal stress protein [Halonotius terrestris]|uniref:Universal stress protein n=1 Tax=Halonotius terrestris TaxID=2487750 RepID=A0A8J8PBW9_9EURY|nr:universal stress protein [Halonotius terrestris]TQQ81182.1 universal stress protein [Halonotius terrestris]